MTKQLSRRAALAMSPAVAAAKLAAATDDPLQTVQGRIAPGKGRFMMPAHFTYAAVWRALSA